MKKSLDKNYPLI